MFFILKKNIRTPLSNKTPGPNKKGEAREWVHRPSRSSGSWSLGPKCARVLGSRSYGAPGRKLPLGAERRAFGRTSAAFCPSRSSVSGSLGPKCARVLAPRPYGAPGRKPPLGAKRRAFRRQRSLRALRVAKSKESPGAWPPLSACFYIKEEHSNSTFQ